MNSPVPLYYHNSKAITRTDLTRAIQLSGIRNGDTIMVHSDIGTFGKLGAVLSRHEFLSELLLAFRETLGAKGTIIVPTYSYSFCKNELFDVNSTPSEVGTLTEFIRTHPDSVRSVDPIFSHAGIGVKANKLLSEVSDSCFGEDSFFDRFYKEGGKLVNFGNQFDITFLHYIERYAGVEYRYDKFFEGDVIYPNGTRQTKNVTYYVRALPEDGYNVNYDMTLLGDELERRNLLTRVKIGSAQVLTTEIKDCFNVGIEMLSLNQFAFLRNYPK